jgi:hypothetical protein
MERIGDQALLKGAAFLRLLEGGQIITIEHRPNLHDALFWVSSSSIKALVLFKVSTAAKRHWQFTFSESELEPISSTTISVPAEQRFLALVCKQDGVCCLSLSEFRALQKERNGGPCVVYVSRPAKGSYRASGPGKVQMPRTIPDKDWPEKIFKKEQL